MDLRAALNAIDDDYEKGVCPVYNIDTVLLVMFDR